MSGRCALYYCLEDLKQFHLTKRGNEKALAYLPAYTCETVIAPYKKAGFELCFYDIDPGQLQPRFDMELIPQIAVLALCGYYGFSLYDRNFVRECTETGAAVVHDITHSVFSDDGIEELADYTAGSFRKWFGIPSGGVAVKRRGSFARPPLPPEEAHIRGRMECFAEQSRVMRNEAGASAERASEIFWDTEMRLRKIFDRYGSDSLSQDILTAVPWRELIRRRRENYQRILEQDPFGPALRPVFPSLPQGVCPSHLSLYSRNRDRAQELLGTQGIKTTVYWPFHGELDPRDFPGAAYIYGHIFSLPVDQRYSSQDMLAVCDALKTVAIF
jgi:dTDP-4-amino-4,6-dideoxygalactose transaminase